MNQIRVSVETVVENEGVERVMRDTSPLSSVEEIHPKIRTLIPRKLLFHPTRLDFPPRQFEGVHHRVQLTLIQTAISILPILGRESMGRHLWRVAAVYAEAGHTTVVHVPIYGYVVISRSMDAFV